MGCALLPWGCSAWRGASRLEGVPAAWMQWRLWTLLGGPPLGGIALPGGAYPLCWEWGLAGTGGAPKEGRSAGGQTQPRTDWRVRWDPATDSGPPENPATALPPLESACSAGRWVRGRPSGAANPARGTWCGRAENRRARLGVEHLPPPGGGCGHAKRAARRALPLRPLQGMGVPHIFRAAARRSP